MLINKGGQKMRLNKELTKKFNKINKIISLDKLLHSDMYYFDNGQVEKMVDINKENVKYTVIKVNTDTSTKDYLVFAIIHTNDKSTTHQLLKSFNTKTKTNEYFKSFLAAIFSPLSNKRLIWGITTMDSIPKRFFNKYLI